MSLGSRIEWTDATFNPWWGCAEVSPGCANCYARTLSARFEPGVWPERGRDGHAREHGFRFFGDDHWKEPLRWAKALPAKLGRRPRVFCASMADVFEEGWQLAEHRGRLWALIQATPELDWLLLTKRPREAREILGDDLLDHPNVWLGVSVENARYTWRADELREIPAAVRFISAEPLLGSLFPDRSRESGRSGRFPLDLTGIDWVIVGGESGPGARPLDLEHAREVVRACMDERDVEGSPRVFVKQLGSVWARQHTKRGLDCGPADLKGGDWSHWPPDLRVREFPESRAREPEDVQATLRAESSVG